MGNGYYYNFSSSYFRFGVSVGQHMHTQILDLMLLIRCWILEVCERGPKIMFRRVQIFDAAGNLLENLEHYKDLYCATELMTSS